MGLREGSGHSCLEVAGGWEGIRAASWRRGHLIGGKKGMGILTEEYAARLRVIWLVWGIRLET